MATRENLGEQIAKIDQEIAATRAATAKRLAELKAKRKPLAQKKRSHDRAADAHCLVLLASSVLASMEAGDVGAHVVTKRALRKLRETQRHTTSLRDWPRLERAFSGFHAVREALGDETSTLSTESISNGDSDASPDLSREQPAVRTPQQSSESVE